MLQAAILKPITERLLREAGLTPGLRVLDLGCGCGDVAMLAAELVGPNGTVVGIDRSADVLAVARQPQATRTLNFVKAPLKTSSIRHPSISPSDATC